MLLKVIVFQWYISVLYSMLRLDISSWSLRQLLKHNLNLQNIYIYIYIYLISLALPACCLINPETYQLSNVWINLYNCGKKISEKHNNLKKSKNIFSDALDVWDFRHELRVKIFIDADHALSTRNSMVQKAETVPIVSGGINQTRQNPNGLGVM